MTVVVAQHVVLSVKANTTIVPGHFLYFVCACAICSHGSRSGNAFVLLIPLTVYLIDCLHVFYGMYKLY